jgi:hypothetical protein
MFVLLQLDTKCLVHGSDRPGENDRPARCALLFYREFVLAGKRLDAGNAVGVSPVLLLEILAA